MAAPASTVPVTAAGKGLGPTSNDVGILVYVQEVVSGAASLLQEMPAEVLPVVGTLCKTFLALEQLVETAKSNKGALSVLRKLCNVVIKGVLVSRTNRPFLPNEGFAELKKHVDKVEKVAKLCNRVGIRGSVERFVLARKISSDIASIRNDVLAFCSVNTLVLADDSHVSEVSLAALPPPLSLSPRLSLSRCHGLIHKAEKTKIRKLRLLRTGLWKLLRKCDACHRRPDARAHFTSLRLSRKE